MGRDIHLNIISKNGTIIGEEIYEGRNQDWFDDMSGKGYNEIYESLPAYYGDPDVFPQEFIDRYTDSETGRRWTYDNRYLVVKDFMDWFSEKRPDIDACWMTTYNKFLYEEKGIVPDIMRHHLDKDDVVEDMHFVKITNPYDQSGWLYGYLTLHNIDPDAYICYCFDS